MSVRKQQARKETRQRYLLKMCPKFYYINLDRSKDRKERMENMFNEYNLDFQRITAVDGKDLTSWDERLNRFEQGCTLSHLKAIETFYDSGDEYGIICEDDMTFDFFHLWKTPIKNIISEAPKDWDIIMLGYIILPKYSDFLKEKYNTFVPIVHNSTLSYLISRKGAKSVLEKHSFTEPRLDLYKKIRPVADVIIYDIVNTYVYKYSIFTYPKNNSSTIHESHSDFHSESRKFAEILFTEG